MKETCMGAKVKKIFAFFLGLCLLIGMMPETAITAFAADGTTVETVNYAAEWNDDGSAVELTVNPQNKGVVYFLMQNSGAEAPDESTVKENASAVCEADQDTLIEIQANDQEAKDIYLIYQNEGSDSSYVMKEPLSLNTFSATSNVKATAAVSEEDKVTAAEVSASTVQVETTPAESGTAAATETETTAIEPGDTETVETETTAIEPSDTETVGAETAAIEPSDTATVDTETIAVEPGDTETTAADETAVTESGAAKTTVAEQTETAETETSAAKTTVAETTETTTAETSAAKVQLQALAADSTPQISLASTISVDYGVKWVSTSSIQLSVTSTKAGTAYYIVQDSGGTVPAVDAVKASGTSIDVTADTESTATVTATTNTAKDVYLVFVDSDGVTYEMTTMTLPEYKTVSGSESSTVGSVSFSGERNGEDYLSLTVEPTVDGRLYYIVKDASEDAPSDAEWLAADSISETADTAKTTQISLGDDPTTEKSLYLRYYAVSDGSLVGGTAVMDVPALDVSIFKAEISPTSLSLGTLLEGYSASDASATATISNTGEGTVSFSVNTSADGYDTFSQYFDVDVSGAVNIASGEKGSVTVTPKEGLTAGTYTGTFYLVDQIDDDNTLTLGPVTVTMAVAEKGTSTVEGVRSPEGEYTPSERTDGALQEIIIDDKVAYCANYN
jgi:hypothetical protein